MVDEITTNPQRSEPMVDKEGLGTEQLIEYLEDIELAFNENLLGRAIIFRSYTVVQLTVIVPPATTPQIPAANFLNGAVIVLNETGGRTIATSDGTNWRRVSDGAIIS